MEAIVFSKDGKHLYCLIGEKVFKFSVSIPFDRYSEIIFIGKEVADDRD